MAGTHEVADEIVTNHTQKLSEIDGRSKSNTHRLNKQEKINEKLNDKIDTVQKMQFTIAEVKNGIDRLNEKMENQQEYQNEIVKNLKEDVQIQREASEKNMEHIVNALREVMKHSNENSVLPWYIVIRDAVIHAFILATAALIGWLIIQYSISIGS